MSRATHIFAPKPPSASAPAVNREQYPAWQRNVQEDLLQTLLTNTLGQTFYVDKHDMIAESEAVHMAALDANPAFYAKALAYARNQGFMRLQPIYGLARLACKNTALFKSVFNQVILIPDDLADFTAILSSLRNGGQGGRAVKTMGAGWLASRMTPYWAIKYGSGQAEQGKYRLQDLYKVYHPKGENPLVAWLLGKDVREGLPDAVVAYEGLKCANNDADRALAIRQGKLPHEIATPFAGDSKVVWTAIAENMPTFALLRNLATLERHGVADAMRDMIEQRFKSPDAVKKAKILPFRFLDAIEKVQAGWLKDAVRDGADAAIANIPVIPGKTVVLLDTSGSMQSSQFCNTAKIFALAIATTSQTTLYAFDCHVWEIAYSRRDSILTQAQSIVIAGSTLTANQGLKRLVQAWTAQPSGTWTSGPIDIMLARGEKADNLVVITDGQQNQGRPFADALAEYRQRINGNVKVFTIDISPYRNALTAPANKNEWAIYGWSDTVLKFIPMAAQGWSMGDYVGRGEESTAE